MLFGLAAGRCSICQITVVEHDVKIGEMAHIIAKNRGGARGHLSAEGGINDYTNLILLCPNHHTEVDDNEELYPPEKLYRIKAEHEAHVQRLFSNGHQGRSMDVAGLNNFLHYFPFTQLGALTSSLPERFDIRLYYLDEAFNNFARDTPQCRPFSDANLESHYYGFWARIVELIDYEQNATIDDENAYMPGSVIGADPNLSYLNRALNIEQRAKAMQDIQHLLKQLSESYYTLMAYLKANYPEVNLASFVGWRSTRGT